MNKAMIIGRVGREPESKAVGDSTVCNFSVATSRKWKDQSGQQQEKTEWHRIVAWDKLAEICSRYLHKGKQIFIEGEIQTRSWETDAGETRYITEIRAFQMEMLGSKSDSRQGQQVVVAPVPSTPFPEPPAKPEKLFEHPRQAPIHPDDDLPF
jgi:single-strand DNA-binding protein